jgi:hypothetical protein
MLPVPLDCPFSAQQQSSILNVYNGVLKECPCNIKQAQYDPQFYQEDATTCFYTQYAPLVTTGVRVSNVVCKHYWKLKEPPCAYSANNHRWLALSFREQLTRFYHKAPPSFSAKVTTCSLYPKCNANLKLPIDTFYRESRSGVNIAKRNIMTGLFGLISLTKHTISYSFVYVSKSKYFVKCCKIMNNIYSPSLFSKVSLDCTFLIAPSLISTVSLDCTFLIAPSLFSKVSLDWCTIQRNFRE